MKLCWETRLDVQVVLCDRVVYCSLDTFAKRGVLVEQGKPERAVCRCTEFLIDRGTDHLVDEDGGILPVRIGCRAVVEDIAGVNISSGG